MSRISDFNLKNWRDIEIYGDQYRAREIYDINESGFGVYGYEVYNENGEFLRCFMGIKSLETLKHLIHIFFYRDYANCSK